MARRHAAGRILGRWRITEMELWDPDDLDLVEPAFIEFAAGGKGKFAFIAVEASMDYRASTTGGRARVEFLWQGNDEGDQVSGRGWAQLTDIEMLEGRIYFHLGDNSAFRAAPFHSE